MVPFSIPAIKAVSFKAELTTADVVKQLKERVSLVGVSEFIP